MSNFNSKEDYLNFIAAWKSAANHEQAKSRIEKCDHTQWFGWPGPSDAQKKEWEAKGYKVSSYSYTIPMGGKCKYHGWLNASHFIFRNMMLGKDPKRGFTPKTAKRKLNAYESPWLGFEQGAWALEFAIKDARNHIEALGMGKESRYGNRAKQFLEPFQGAVSVGQLAKIDLEALEDARKIHR